MEKNTLDISLERDRKKEKAYLEASEEFESANRDKGLFAKLFVELNGDEKRVKIAYLEIRAREIFSLNEKSNFLEIQTSSHQSQSSGLYLSTEIQNDRLKKYQRLQFCSRLIILWFCVLIGLIVFNSNFPEVFEGDHPFFGLIFGLCFLIPFMIVLNSIWYLANEAGKYGSIWAICSWIFFPLGFVISYFRLRNIALKYGWLNEKPN